MLHSLSIHKHPLKIEELQKLFLPLQRIKKVFKAFSSLQIKYKTVHV